MIILLVNRLFLHIFTEDNLDKDTIVFTVKKLISNFKGDFPLKMQRCSIQLIRLIMFRNLCIFNPVKI